MHKIEQNVTTGQTTIIQFTTKEEVEYQAKIFEYAAGADLRKAIEIRSIRNEKLKDSDWSQCVDIPQTIKDEYAVYRQTLRDLPSQSGFPNSIVWPTQP